MSKLSMDRNIKNSGSVSSIWWILVLVINLYMMLTVIYTTYSFSTPVIVVFPWLLAALMSKDKKAWIRVALIFILGLIIHIAIWLYDMFIITGIEDFFEQKSAMHVTIWIREIFWIILIVYALRIRKEVAAKIAIAQGVKKRVVNDIDKVAAMKRTQPDMVVMAETKQKPIVQANNTLKEESIEEQDGSLKTGKLDINKCSEAEFMTLPGMSLLSAKKAVENREQNGDYESVDDFVVRNGIKPHFMMQMEDKIYVMITKKISISSNEKKGRVLDL